MTQCWDLMILFNFILQDEASDDDDADADTVIMPTKSKRPRLFGPSGASTVHSAFSDSTWHDIESDDDEGHIKPSRAKRQNLDGPLRATTSSALEDVMYQPKYLC